MSVPCISHVVRILRVLLVDMLTITTMVRDFDCCFFVLSGVIAELTFHLTSVSSKQLSSRF